MRPIGRYGFVEVRRRDDGRRVTGTSGLLALIAETHR